MENDQSQLLKTITSLLSKFNIPYMITGAWSVIYYGRPRASHDIDFVVELFKSDTLRVLKAMQSLSPDFSYELHTIPEAIDLNTAYLNKWAKTLKITHFLKKLPKIDLEKYL